MSLLVVCPFFSGDEHLLLNNLEWIKELDGNLDYDCLLSCDNDTAVGPALKAAKEVFRNVASMKYPRVSNSAWPNPQNNAFLQTAWHVYAKHKGPWLWLETDSIPMCKGWLDALWNEYQKGGKPFGGHWNFATNVFNGVAIYPQNISQYSQAIMMAALTEAKDTNGTVHQVPWDVYGSGQVRKHLHVMNGLMQHIWRDDATGEAWTFPCRATVERVIRPGVVLFHRCKNESLVARLREAGSSHVQKAITADVVSLRRNGDIVSLLPLLRRMSGTLARPVKLAVMREYAPLLEGISYVEAVPCDGDMEDPLLFSEQLNAVNAQVFGKRLHPDFQRSNFVKQAWLQLGHKWDRYAPLVFDRRNLEREAELASKTFQTDKPKILVKMHGYSSPFAEGKSIWKMLDFMFSESAELVNLDAVKAERVFDLIGLMDRAACLVTVDTVTTHLAQASMCPTIQFTNNSKFGASPARGNCLLRMPYMEVDTKLRRLIITGLVQHCLFPVGNQQMALVFNHWVPKDSETRRRQDAAYETWLKFPARLASFPVKRSSVSVGDPRGMPFVRDMIAFALSGTEDIVVISNNDIRFDERLSADMLASCARCGCWWAYRTDHYGGPTDNGADVFAFTRKWWRIHEHMFPDFLLGYWWWDDVMVRMMRWSGCAEQRRLYYHEPHPATQAPARQHTPGAKHNERLANAWLYLHDERREKPA